MGKVRRCKRCGKEAWIVAEITSVIPSLCLPCFEHITGGEDFPRLVANLRGSRSVRLAESENILLNSSWSQLENKFRSFGAPHSRAWQKQETR